MTVNNFHRAKQICTETDVLNEKRRDVEKCLAELAMNPSSLYLCIGSNRCAAELTHDQAYDLLNELAHNLDERRTQLLDEFSAL